MIEIRETCIEDIEDVKRLWDDGEVMKFVGFPEGLQESIDEMKEWYKWIEEGRPKLNHYSIFEDGIYCGEAFYQIDRKHENAASLDIKIFPFARGRGIATKALSYAISQAFLNGASKVWVDPNKENLKAIALYERLGFVRKEMPKHLIDPAYESISIYMELENRL